MTQNNFYVIIILIRIKIYKKIVTPPRSAALFTSFLIKVDTDKLEANRVVIVYPGRSYSGLDPPPSLLYYHH